MHAVARMLLVAQEEGEGGRGRGDVRSRIRDTRSEIRNTGYEISRIPNFESRFSRQSHLSRLSRVEHVCLFRPIRLFSACTGCATVSALVTSCVVCLVGLVYLAGKTLLSVPFQGAALQRETIPSAESHC